MEVKGMGRQGKGRRKAGERLGKGRGRAGGLKGRLR